MSLIIAILIFGFIIFIHELGHFIFAKRNGILVEEFAIGMGKVLYSVQKGDTKYSIRLLPIGGFCAMLGEDKDEFDPRSFNAKSVKARMVVILGGALFNIILAFLIFTGFALFTNFQSMEIVGVAENSFASEQGVRVGDVIKEINGNKITNYNEIFFETQFSKDGQLNMIVDRDGEEVNLSGIMKKNQIGDYYIGVNTKIYLGAFAKAVEGYEKANIFQSLKQGVLDTYFIFESTFLSIELMLNKTISPDKLTGPIGIVNGIGDSYDKTMESAGAFITFLSMLKLMAFLSASVAVFNLLPLPALDGGRFVFLVYEFITKKRFPPEKEGIVHIVGFIILMMLALVVAFNDIINVFNIDIDRFR